jgi:hypothetical protein
MPRRFLAALTATLTLLLVTPGPAYAWDPWPSPVCTEVEFTDGSVQQSPVMNSYSVSGYVRACPGADDPAARWTIVRYKLGELGAFAARQPYGVPGSRGFRFLYRRYAPPGTWAVCVVNDVRPTKADPLASVANRVACVGADPAGPTPSFPGGPVLSTRLVPIPVDDPRFEGVLVGEETGGPHTICTGCV